MQSHKILGLHPGGCWQRMEKHVGWAGRASGRSLRMQSRWRSGPAAPGRPRARGPEAGQSPAAPSPARPWAPKRGLKRPESPPPGSLPPWVCADARGPAISPDGSARRRREPGDPPRPQGSGGAASGPWTPFPGTGRPLALPRANSCGPGPAPRAHTHPVCRLWSPQEGRTPAPNPSLTAPGAAPGVASAPGGRTVAPGVPVAHWLRLGFLTKGKWASEQTTFFSRAWLRQFYEALYRIFWAQNSAFSEPYGSVSPLDPIASCVSPIKALSTLSLEATAKSLLCPSSHHRLWSGLMNELEFGLHEVPQSEFFQCGFRQKIQLRMCTRERTLILLQRNNTFNYPFLILLL